MSPRRKIDAKEPELYTAPPPKPPKPPRQWGLPLVASVAGVLIAVAGGRIWGAGALLIAATGFWLFDRGVPGNRPRPGWLRAWAVLLVVIAIAVLTLTLAAVRAG